MKRAVGIGMMLGLLLTTTLAFAQPGPFCDPDPDRPFWSKLDLTEEQQAKLAELRLQFAKETLATRNELGVKRLELQQLLMADSPDQKAIEAKVDEIHKLQATLQKKRIAHHLAVWKLLTPEQRKKAREMGWSRMGWGKPRWGGGVREQRRIMLREGPGPERRIEEKVIEVR
ncbi:MAG: Spy/CpxP family protein refolding chaperone [candidate division KSB1 bacterium]|nr:Spy/CpxP family protein refolding chaperone [candidate division KSB1 bacterium]